MVRTGRLLGSGRDNDVYELDGTWVLRRNRRGWGDACAEAAAMDHVRAHGYPVPPVRPADCTRTDLIMEHLAGPTMLQALAAGEIFATEAGTTLATLLHRLHTVPGRTRPDLRVLHLDLHPDNVILTPEGPRVIDWSNTEEGDPALDWAMSAVILAQVAVAATPLSAPAHTLLSALLADPAPLTAEALTEARRRRAANVTMSREEVGVLGEAEELVRGVMRVEGR
jgi:aminoglycoside phosphotransferase (APT) family kinase protein